MADEAVEVGRPGHRIKQWWFAHPVVGFVGTLASVIAIPLAIYFGVTGQPTRRLLIASAPPVIIVNAGQASSVDVVYHGKKLTTSVYAVQLYLWNDGTDSIRAENILEPIGVVLPGASILETHVRRVSRPLTNITISTVQSDTVMASWKILEHFDGAAIDVIYTGTLSGKIKTTGTIEHQPQIRISDYQSTLSDFLSLWFTLMSLGGGILFALFVIITKGIPEIVGQLKLKDYGAAFVGAFVVLLGVTVLWILIIRMAPSILALSPPKSIVI